MIETSMSHSKLGETVRKLRKKKGLTLSQLADQVEDYDAGNLSRFERGQQKITISKLEGLAKALGVTVAKLYDLADDESHKIPRIIEEPIKEEDLKIAEISPVKYLEKLTVVPLISAVQAGEWSAIVDDFLPGDADKWIETTAKVGPSAFALKVVGDSMTNPNGMPSIPEGFIVIVDPDVEPINGRVVVARLESQTEATIKKLVIDGPNKYLMPLNPRYDKIVINGDCTIVGVVVKMEYDLI